MLTHAFSLCASQFVSCTVCLGVRKWPVKDNGNEHFAPSFWMRAVGRLASVQGSQLPCFRTRVRSHSSKALCANVPVCGGAFWAVGVPNARMKGLSGSVEDGRSAIL